MVALGIVLDVDVGTDDALALLMFLLAGKLGVIKILAIIISNGNTNIENATRNTARFFDVLNITHIPIYQGVPETIFVQEAIVHDNFHGRDGLGDLNLNWQPDMSMVHPDVSGILAIRDVIKAEPAGSVTLVCLGPLTNAALLLKTFGREFQLKEIAIMGGNDEALGNITPNAEFNFYFDPEAARIVFDVAANLPILMVPWETCIQAEGITTEWRFGVTSTNKGWELLTLAERNIYKNLTKWQPCDAMLAATLLYPKTIEEFEYHKVTVETQGLRTRGQAVILHGAPVEERNVKVVTSLDSEEFKVVVEKVAKESIGC